MPDPSSNEGLLLVQLAQWASIAGIDEATASVFDEDFDPDSADPRDDAVRKTLMWGETLGTLTKNGLLAQELVLDWQWIAGLWARVGRAALASREEYGEPKLYENFEALAKAQSG
jgi:hypothetical protein